MVDHRADDDQGLKFFVTSGEETRWRGPALGDRVATWLGGLFGPALSGQGGWTRTHTIAAVLTGLWALILGAYGVGYFLRLDPEVAGARTLPTLDLLFFAFAVIGPIAMIWVIVGLLSRTARLADAIAGQSESALALAATLANLHESVDAFSAGTTGRLEQACDRMEREAAASVKKLDAALRQTSEKLDTALLDSVILLDQTLRERTERMEHTLEDQRASLARRLSEDADRLADAIEREATALGAAQAALTSRIETGFADSKARLDDAMQKAVAHQQAGIDTANRTLTGTVGGLASALTTQMEQQADRVDKGLQAAYDRLTRATETASRAIDVDLAAQLSNLATALRSLREQVGASPPASAEKLAALLGESAHVLVRPERAALNESIQRISQLEDQAGALIARIDRTSRLNPLIDRSDTMELPEADAATSAVPDELPFEALPRGPGRVSLNWTGVVQVLAAMPVRPGTQHIVDAVRADADIVVLMRLRDEVLTGLSEDGLFIEDLETEHATAALWARYGGGVRGGDVLALAGIRDEIAQAIARGWMRRSPEARAMALRYCAQYQRLLMRAVPEIGADPRLIELADTSAGRLFMLLGGLTGAFAPVPATEG